MKLSILFLFLLTISGFASAGPAEHRFQISCFFGVDYYVASSPDFGVSDLRRSNVSIDHKSYRLSSSIIVIKPFGSRDTETTTFEMILSDENQSEGQLLNRIRLPVRDMEIREVSNVLRLYGSNFLNGKWVDYGCSLVRVK